MVERKFPCGLLDTWEERLIMKRAIIFALALVLAMGCMVTGTTAFFTDSVSAQAVLTVGNIDVAQIEKMRGTDGLVDYAQNRALYPAVYDDNMPTESYAGSVASTADDGKTTELTFDIWKDAKVAGVHDKMVFVENVGSNPFYFRTVFAFEADEEKSIEHIILNKNERDYEWEDIGPAEIEGKTYVLMTATYNWEQSETGSAKYADALAGTLPSGVISEPSLIQVAMDKAAQNDYVKYFGDEYNILVVTQAIQTTTMADEYNALTAAEKGAYTCVGDYALDKGFDPISETSHPFAGLVKEEGESGETSNAVEVTAANWGSIDFEQDNVVYKLSGEFTESLTLDIPEGLNQTYDASGATFADATTVTINAPGVAHAYSSLKAERKGSVTITGFEVQTLNVLAYNNKEVTIFDNKVSAMSVIGGNFALAIDGNTVDGNFGTYTDGEGQANEYGISLRITDYELSITDNTITDTYSHAIGLNGRQGEAASDWGSCGAKNKIEKFSGNNITLNTTQKTGRGALKIWCDQVYAPYATSRQEPNSAAKALMEKILADTTNVFALGTGHTVFNIFDYKTSTGA